MQLGVSTASLFTRYKTEDALTFLNKNGIKTAEVFLASFCEYKKKFGKKLDKVKGGVDVHSVHVLTTQYEPQLYSINERAMEDSFVILEDMLRCAKKIGAKYYTFHGTARLKKLPMKMDFDKIAATTQKIIDVCAKYNVTLSYENVHWCYYNYVGFFTELKKRTKGLKGTLDLKQARLSGATYIDFLNEMKEDLVTVHLSDVDENGKLCLPGKGITDFYDLFSRLSDVGFNGAALIESYPSDYSSETEIFDSLNFLEEISDKVF